MFDRKDPKAVTKKILPKANLPINEYSTPQTKSRSVKLAKNALVKGRKKDLAKPI
jgi:hypothetical protein